MECESVEKSVPPGEHRNAQIRWRERDNAQGFPEGKANKPKSLWGK
jgi:hypothetical protein